MTAPPARSLPRTLAYGALAAMALASLAGWFALRVDGITLHALAFLLMAGLSFASPHGGIAACLALWPVADLTLWNGQYYATESDGLLLACVAGAALRETVAGHRAPHTVMRAPAPARILLLMLMLCLAIGCWRGAMPLPSLDDANAFTGVASRLNALRLFKGYVWALFLIPVLHSAVNRAGDAGLSVIRFGVLGSLLFVGLACGAERALFPGLMNMASDYRSTAPFWETHTGGAALDAFLAMTWPFALALLLRAQRARQLAPAVMLLGLASYALLTTFSRGAYGAAVVAVLVSIAMAWPASSGERGRRWFWVVPLAGIAGTAAATAMFASGGYRGLLAWCMLAGGVFALAPRLAGARMAEIMLGALVALSVGVAAGIAASWWGKLAYLTHAALFGAVMLLAMLPRLGTAMRVPALGLLAALGISAVNVARAWGGEANLVGAVFASAALLVPLVITVGSLRSAWSLDIHSARWVALGLAVACSGAVASGSWFMSGRFATTGGDLAGRVEHWHDAAGLIRDGEDGMFGIGMGRFAETYFWTSPEKRLPGGFRIGEERGNRFMILTAPHYSISWGDMFRVGQRVDRFASGNFEVAARVRASARTTLHAEVCNRQLLYTENCAYASVGIPAGPDWRQIHFRLAQGDPAPHANLWQPPRFFALGLEDSATRLDIDDIVLSVDGAIVPLANGRFDQGAPGWFFTSDRLHLPWHAKNLWLALVLDAGMSAALLFSALLCYAFGRAVIRLRSHAWGAPLAGAVGGVIVVGLFDSLVDIPRITMLIMVLAWMALAVNPRPVTVASRPERSVRRFGAVDLRTSRRPPRPDDHGAPESSHPADVS